MVKTQTLFDKLFQDSNRLTLKTAVDRVLHVLSEEQQPMQVLVGRNSAFLAQANLLHYEEQGGSLILDELVPDAANTYLRPGEDLLLWAVHTLPVGFQTKVLECLTWQRFAAIRIQGPATVFQLQRRGTLRAPMDSSAGASVLLRRFGAKAVEGNGLDISAGGMRIDVPAPHDYPLTPGELLAQIQFQFQGRPYSLGARVCHTQSGTYPGAQAQQLGLFFLDPPAALEEQVIQYAIRHDRERLRRAYR